MTDEEMAEEYFKSVCEDYNEELERTGKRHYWVGFDIKNAYLAGLKAGRELAYKEMNTEKMLKVLKDRDVIKSWYYNGAYHAEVD